MSAPSFDAALANNAFGIDLYRQLAATRAETNLILSPYSICQALALATAGAAGTTRAELAHALHLAADDAAIQTSFAALRLALDSAAKKTVESLPNRQRWDPDASTIEWHPANRIFGQIGYAFRESYLSLAQSGYGAALESLDFCAEAEPARVAINTWVEDQTHQKIRDLIPPGGVSPTTRLVLINALYLKAPWEWPFDPKHTAPRTFHLRATESRSVATMAITSTLPCLHSNGFTTVALDYLGGELQFVVFLPDEGMGTNTVAAKLTPAFLRQCTRLSADQHVAYVSLFLPKFRVTGHTLPLRRELGALGVAAAFDSPVGSADFTPIAPRQVDEYLMFSEVFHQTFLALEEGGTEAAAATGGAVAAGAAMPPPKPIEVRVDRPFLFAIQHVPSGACLFLGHIVDPR